MEFQNVVTPMGVHSARWFTEADALHLDAFWFPSTKRSLADDFATYERLKFARLTGWARYLRGCMK